MGVYVGVRGWLECDDRQLALVREAIDADADHYDGGWAFPAGPSSWTNYVFYGADLRAHEVAPFLDLLRRLAALPASDPDDDRVCGLFLASHEVDGMAEWRIHAGRVLITPAGADYAYLDT